MLWRPFLQTMRAGDVRARFAALRSSREALRVAVAGAAVRTGLLEELLDGPASADELADRRGWADPSLVEAALKTFAAHGWVQQQGRRWATTDRGRRIVADDVVRAVYEAFSGYHTELYRDLDRQLRTGGTRRDVEVDAELVARLSRFMDQFVIAELDRVIAERPPRHLLDVGCGTAAHLRHVLQAVPEATAVGVETDHAAVALARAAVAEERLESRAEVLHSDLESFLDQRPEEAFDLVLLANVVYYFPLEDRVSLLRSLADRLTPGGQLLVITTVPGTEPFSRHFDLLLRSQAGNLELPAIDVLCRQLTEAGLVPKPPRRIAVGEPLTAVLAHADVDDGI
jgi:SAM-dependent methyltransferase